MEQKDGPSDRVDTHTAVPDELFSIDAKYVVDYAEDGVIIEISCETGSGAPLVPELVVYDLNHRGITGLNISDILLRLKRRENLFKLAEPQPENTYDSDVAVQVGRDEMSAAMMIFPPSPEGNLKSPEEIMEILKQRWGVTHGLDETAIRDAVDGQQYFKLIAVAKGLESVRGKDGSLTFLFKTEHSYAPHILNDGSADYKNLDIFESVKEDDVVVVSIPPEDGTDGYTVKGKVLPAQKGVAAKLPKGKNVKVSDDGLSLIAAKSGRVDYIGGRVEISDVYNIRGDVDLHVGNIDFTGDLMITGAIIAGLTVKATGNIEVQGTVDASTLIAGKDIILKNGMQGTNKGLLQAGGNVVARFLERCTVEAKGSVFSDYIAHSTVSANESIIMKGKHGKIIGGISRAGKQVVARTLGSLSSDPTVIEVGVSPEFRTKLTELETERNTTKIQLDKLESVARVLPSSASETPERAAMRQKFLDAREQYAQRYSEVIAEIEKLKEILSAKSNGKVHVFATVYPDVKIVIDSCPYPIKSTVEFVTFRYKEGEVVFSSCEIKPN